MATQNLMSLTSNQFIDLNVNKIGIYRTAMKVFFASFCGYESIPFVANRYQSNLKVYQTLMRNALFLNISDQRNQQIIHEIKNELESSIFFIHIGVVRAIGIKDFHNTEIMINTENPRENLRIGLNSYQEIQSTTSPQVMQKTFAQLSELRSTNKSITIDFNSTGHMSSSIAQQFKKFRIAYRDIHAEGFKDWVDFGNGVKLLIKIAFRSDDRSVDQTQTHIQFIFNFLYYRIYIFNTTFTNISSMFETYFTKKTDTLRKGVDFKTQNAYWNYPPDYDPLSGKSSKFISAYASQYRPRSTSTDAEPPIPEQHKYTSFIEYLKSHQMVNIRAKYHDLHIMCDDFYHDIKEEFCVCSEWCNWSAFFFYNPIFRFVLVQHHQLYLRRAHSLSMPEVYLFICCRLLTVPNVRLPIHRLLKSAKEYSEQNYVKSLTDNTFKVQQKTLSDPNCQDLLGVSYNLLMAIKTTLSHAVILTEIPVFNNLSIDCVKNFFEVYLYVHNRIAEMPLFVDQNVRRQWYKLFVNETHKSYYDFLRHYLNLSYQTIGILIYEDILFNIDYNMFVGMEKRKGIEEVIRLRNKVRQFDDNPYNVKFICGQILAIIICTNSYMQRIDPTLPSAESSAYFLDAQAFTFDVEIEFEKMIAIQNLPKRVISAQIIRDEQNQRRMPFNDIYYYKYFTLKCYDIGYSLQHRFISATTYLNQRYYPFIKGYHILRFSCRDLNFVYRNDWIEASLKNYDPNPTNFLFEIETSVKQLKVAFNNFYRMFWNTGIPVRSMSTSIQKTFESIGLSYIKLYLWYKLNGNTRTVFVIISKTLHNLLAKIYQKSELIFNEDIIRVMKNDRTNYEYKSEVIDILVYWLVKANCFIFISIAAQFLKLIHALQDNNLFMNLLSFPLSRPGMTQFIRTLHTSFLHYVHRIKFCYIGYDDEFARISKALDETRTTLKHLYRDMYSKLNWSWCHELMNLIVSPMPVSQMTQIFMMFATLFTICTGVAFNVAFVNDFRQSYRRIRKFLPRIRAHILSLPNRNHYHNSVLTCLDVSYLWIQDRDEIEAPLRAQRWTHYFQNDLFKYIEDSNDQYLNLFGMKAMSQ